MHLAEFINVEDKIIEIRNQHVIIDSDVAELYGIDTKRVNEAVSRNPDKFLNGYLIELTQSEWELVKSQFATSPNPLGGGKVRAPKAFTEKGLYMLATILKSLKATDTTLSIIETFAKVREISRTIKANKVMWYTSKANVITLYVYVLPGAKSTEITGLHNGLLKIRLSAQAIEGRANEALQKFMAQLFQVPNRQVRLVHGDKGKSKTLEIMNSIVDPEHLLLRVGKE